MTHSDCIAYLRTLPDASVDSCVTDPPYELGFMGKKWDSSGIAYSVELWREVLRTLKPGAHLLAFGGTRTHHRMVCAIEDAGFEIRDEMQWLYGSGFPKSLDVSKAVEKVDAVEARLSRRYLFTEWMVSVCPLTGAEMDKVCGTNTMGRHWTDRPPGGKQPDVATREHFEKLRPHFTCAVPDWIEKLVDERTVESENFKRREVVGKHPEGSSPGGFGEHRFTFNSQDITAPATAAAKQWQGWGTALKPACEPICVARKPLCGTVAANVLAHGTGAINVDGSRIDSGGTHGSASSAGLGSGKPASGVPFVGGVISAPHPKGRWPANVILSHAEGCVCTGTKRVKGQADRGLEQTQARSWKNSSTAGINRTGHADADGLETVEAWQCVEGCPVRLLDAQSGESKSTTGVRDPNGTMGYHGGASGLPGIVSGHSDTGGASRFFYTAKSSKSDREHFNTHATVKPLALMRYLVRLVTPPGGVVLDMFAGSGTTLVAARQEGFRFLGCDADEGHVRIAQDRLALELPFET